MDLMPLKPERKAQLEEYAKRHGRDPVAALDDALAAYLEEEQLEYNETVDAVRAAYEEVKAGRTRPAGEFLDELCRKHGLPR
jgi:predicted transcriptional regulator